MDAIGSTLLLADEKKISRLNLFVLALDVTVCVPCYMCIGPMLNILTLICLCLDPMLNTLTLTHLCDP